MSLEAWVGYGASALLSIFRHTGSHAEGSQSRLSTLDLSYTLNGGEDIETASAEETEEDCIDNALEFLLHALQRLGQALDPIPMGEEEEEEDEEEELDSLSDILDAVVAPLPESLQVLAYSLLTEGDDYLVECLQQFLQYGDVKQVQEDVLARLQIAVKSMEADEMDSLAEVLDAVVAPLPASLQVLAYSLLTEGDGYLVECLKVRYLFDPRLDFIPF